MNQKSEKKQDAENGTCINLDNFKKFGRVIPKPKHFLEIGKSHAINNVTGLRVDLVYGISVQAEPLVICNDKAFRLRWIDVLALALKQSTLIQESVSMPEDTEPEENEELHKDEISYLDEMSMNLNSEKGGEE